MNPVYSKALVNVKILLPLGGIRGEKPQYKTKYRDFSHVHGYVQYQNYLNIKVFDVFGTFVNTLSIKAIYPNS